MLLHPSITFQDALQKKFINVVNDMIEHGVDLPNEFELFYVVTEYNDRGGQVLNIKPYINIHSAHENFRESNEFPQQISDNCIQSDNTGMEEKYWSINYKTILTSRNYEHNDQYHTSAENRTLHEIDYKPVYSDI